MFHSLNVVAATKVYGYESGKDKGGFLPRPDVGETSYMFEQMARHASVEGDWTEFIRLPEPPRGVRAFVGPIAAGEKVVADTRGSTLKFLRHYYGDALAVEMEGRGFLKAARANHPVQALVVRGISDLLKHKSSTDGTGGQNIAAHCAAAFAFTSALALVLFFCRYDDNRVHYQNQRKFEDNK